MELAAAELSDLAGHSRGCSKDRVIAVSADVTDPEACVSAVQEVLRRFGSIYALVNNAGLGSAHLGADTGTTRFWETDRDRWREIMLCNAFGPYFMARAAAPTMIAAGSGRIVNVSTSRRTMLLFSPYGASKAALEMLTRNWARDLDGSGVTVNVLLPGGATDTEFIPGVGPNRWGGRALLPSTVMNRAFVWLLSPDSTPFTGRSFVGRLWHATDTNGSHPGVAMRSCPVEPEIV